MEKGGENRMRIIAFSDRKKMKEMCPFTLKTMYKMRCLGEHPNLTVKVGGKVCLNLDALDKMVNESLKKQRVRAAKLQKIRKQIHKETKSG